MFKDVLLLTILFWKLRESSTNLELSDMFKRDSSPETSKESDVLLLTDESSSAADAEDMEITPLTLEIKMVPVQSPGVELEGRVLV